MSKIRIAIVDDHAVVRQGLAAAFESIADITVTSTGAHGEEAIALCESSDAPDVLVMDISMPVMSGIDACREIRKRQLPVRILILTQFGDVGHQSQVVHAGADGMMLKTSSIVELADSIRRVHFGERVLPAVAESITIPASGLDILTPREIDVLRLMSCDGMTAKEIADRLHISASTVEAHRKNMMVKFRVSSSLALVRIAVEAGLCRPDYPLA